MCPSLKTVPESSPLVTKRPGRSLPALPSVPHAMALATKGDQDRQGPCLVRSSRVRPMGKAIQDGDTNSTREGLSDNDGNGTSAAAADHWDALLQNHEV